MKPIHLTMQAFCSYAGRADIPFERLGGRGLYLITGNTGSGKTTIFDAICFALYGVASGEARRDDSLLRCDVAAPDVESYVEFTFTHAGRPYRVRRSPGYARQRRRGAGLTWQEATAALYLPSGKVIEKKTAVDWEIERLLGIERRYFSSTAMIAQGDFARLLLAGANERREILQQIFGTQFYERVQQTLSQRAKALEASHKAAQGAMEAGYARLIMPKGEPEIAIKGPSSAYRFEEWRTEAMLRVAQGDDALAGKIRTREDAQRESDALIRRRAEAERGNEDLDRLDGARLDIDRLAQESDAIDRMRAELTRAEAAGHADGEARAHADAARMRDAMKADIGRKGEMVGRLHDQLPSLRQALEAAALREPDARQAEREAANLTASLPRYGELAALKERATRADVAAAEAARAYASASAEETKSVALRYAAAEERSRLTGVGAELERRRAECASQKEALVALQRLCADMKAFEAGRTGLRHAQDIARSAADRAKALADRHAALRRAFLLGQAGLMAAALNEGEPCPVCGATSHPHKAHLPKATPTQAEVDAAEAVARRADGEAAEAVNSAQVLLARRDEEEKRLRAEWEKHLIRDLAPERGSHGALPTAVDKAQERVEMQTSPAGASPEGRRSPSGDADWVAADGETLRQGMPLSAAQGAAQALQARLNALLSETDALESQVRRLTELEALIERCDRALEASRAALKRAERARADGEREKAAAEAGLDALRVSLPYPSRSEAESRIKRQAEAFAQWQRDHRRAAESVADCESRLRAGEGELQALDHQAEAQTERVRALWEAFQRALDVEGFEDEAQYLAARRLLGEIARLRAEIKRHDDALNALKSGLSALENAARGAVRTDLGAIDAQASSVAARIRELDAEIGRTEFEQRANHRLIEELTIQEGAFQRLDREYQMVSKLSDTANGRTVDPDAGRQSFELYVLSELFDEVVGFANMRFLEMTGGQYELLRDRSVRSRVTQFGLDLNVKDNFVGTERAVQSLSGGESFMASLSLALGFADAIGSHAGGVEMDSLFVDEGFGTLDETALDQVMAALNRLAKGDKLIGLISHVPELRRRIDRQIVVRKDRMGGSHVNLEV